MWSHANDQLCVTSGFCLTVFGLLFSRVLSDKDSGNSREFWSKMLGSWEQNQMTSPKLVTNLITAETHKWVETFNVHS